MHNTYIYIAIMFLVTFLIRVLPLTLIRRKSKTRAFVLSFFTFLT